MKALVYHGHGQIALEDRPMPIIQDPNDVIIKVSKTTICGTDLAILKDGVSTCRPGRVIGHEATGYIIEKGSAVTNFNVGDHVIIPCTSSCGSCANCKRGIFSSCDRGGWIIGNMIDGLQAEYARIPLADSSLHKIPAGMNEEAALMLADIIPTGLEVGVQKARIGLGDSVVIIGAGPVGLAAVLSACFYSPSQIIVIDRDDFRLQKATELGATAIINNKDINAQQRVMDLTDGRGADVVIEVVGSSATFQLAQELVGAGGRMANVGIFSKSAEIHNNWLWTRNISLHMGVVNTNTVPVLIKMVQAGKLDPTCLISHHFPFTDIIKAYEIYKDAAQQKAIKIILTTDESRVIGCTPAPALSDEELVQHIVNKVMSSL